MQIRVSRLLQPNFLFTDSLLNKPERLFPMLSTIKKPTLPSFSRPFSFICTSDGGIHYAKVYTHHLLGEKPFRKQKVFFLPVSPPRMCCTAHTNDRLSASAFDFAAEASARVSVSRVRSHRASNRPCCQDPLPTLFFCPSVPAPRERPPPPSRNAPFPLPP